MTRMNRPLGRNDMRWRVPVHAIHWPAICKFRFDRRSASRAAQNHEERIVAKYSKKAQQEVKKALHEKKEGTLRNGKSGKKVTSSKQAIAIGLSKARKKGAKVPKKSSD